MARNFIAITLQKMKLVVPCCSKFTLKNHYYYAILTLHQLPLQKNLIARNATYQLEIRYFLNSDVQNKNKRTYIFIIMFLLFTSLFYTFQCGSILNPTGVTPIWNSVANANVKAKYIFSFVLETYLASGSQIEVKFPLQYDSSLGTTQSSLACTPICTLSGRSVIFTYAYEMKNGTTYTASVEPILNPSSQGGTANFILRSMRGENVIDENLIFGIIGIADSINTMVFGEVVVNPTGSLYAGDYSQYILKFKTTSTITSESYMYFTVPKAFELEPFPVCTQYPINKIQLTGTLYCSLMNLTNVVYIQGITGTVLGLQEYAILISMRNPKYAGTTDTFSLGIYKAKTQMMYEQVTGVTGVTIVAAQLQNVSMTPVYSFINSESRIMDYEIRFTPTFPIPAGCNIKLSFPAYMTIIWPTAFYSAAGQFQMHYVKYGLEDLNEDNPLGFTYIDTTLNYLRITNFKEMSQNNEICVVIRVINPSISGYTTPLKLYVYQDLTEYILLQSDVLYGIATVASTTAGNQSVTTTSTICPAYFRSGFSPNSCDESITNTIANQQIISQMTFYLYPSNTVPKYGYIYVTVPSQFTVDNNTATGINAANCKFYLVNNVPALSGFTSPTNSLSCTASGQVIKIELPFALDVIQYPQSVSSIKITNNWQLKIFNSIYTPGINGTYFFDVTFKNTDDSTVMDSISYPVQIFANSLSASTISVNSIPKNQGEMAIVDISFITILSVPSGQTQFRASDRRGFLEFHFSNIWASDLGTGLSDGSRIPCYGVNGLIPYEGNQLKCILYKQSTPIVRVSNFREISTNTKVRIMISGVKNPSAGSYTVDIMVFSKQNRVFTLLNQYLGFSSTLNAAVASTACTATPSYSESRVGFLFDLSIPPCLSTAISAGYYILIQLPTYDTGFIQQENTITCSLASAQLYCIPLIGSDQILIVTTSAVSVSPQPIFIISNLQWPRYVQDFSTYSLNFLVVNNVGLQVVQKYQFSNLNDALPAQFSTIQSLVSNKGKGFVDATYQFTFTPQADIPQGATIVIEFPTFYDFLNGIYLPSFSQSGLVDSSSSSVSIQVNLRLIKITGFQLFNSGDSFTVTAVSVKNSDSYTTASGFSCYVLYNGNFVLQQMNFYSFDFTTAFQTGKIVINQITASILNADEEADYQIQFTPQNDVPIGGQILVTFPANNYKKLPATPDCRISGGINTFQSCTLNAQTFTIETNSVYKSGNGVVNLVIKNVQNPDQGTTDGFVIETQFNGVTLDGTDQSNLNGRTFTAAKKCNTITVNSLVVDPKNEGEEASYRFNFLPYSSLTTSSLIEFKFPVQFDPRLGRDIQCKVNSGLSGGSYTCSVNDGIVALSGFDAYTPELSNQIDVTIFGIVNPNSNGGSATDYLKIYIRQSGSSTYDQSNSEVSQLTFLSAPGWSPLLSIDVSTYYVRWNSTYNFTFQTYKNVPKVSASGSVLIDFPSQFEITDGSITCFSTTAFAATLTCTSYRNRITAKGNYDDYEGKLYIQLKKVLNPIEQGSSDFFYIRTYDGLNLQIIERNFANLDPFKYSYQYPGPLIKVNDENTVTIERGTVAVNIPITIESPCLLNLNLVPSSNDLVVQPASIQLTLGLIKRYFNISVPQSMADGTYTVYWTLDNELDPPLYTPVKRTLVQVTKKQGVKIIQPAILSVPIIGESLLTQYVLPAPPDTQLKMSLYLQKEYFAIKLSTSLITIDAGQSVFGFRVLYDKSINPNGTQVVRGYVTLALEGVNQNVYSLPSTSVEFFIISQDTKAPTWETCEVTNIKKTSVDLVVSLSEPCIVYYVIALKGTEFPTLGDFQNQKIYYTTTQSQMGYIIAYTSSTEYTITLNNLYAQTEYVIHILGLDRGNNQADKQSLEFTTLDKAVSCYFTLIFNQKSVSSDFVRNVTESVAKILGIDEYYLQEQKYYLNSRRILQNSFGVTVDEIKSYIDLELAAIPNIESFPDPYDVISGLQNKTQLLTSRLETLNLTQEVVAIKFVPYVPRFIKKPKIVYIDYQQCAIQVAISNYGWGFAVAVAFESQGQVAPSPYQIMKGLDYLNRPTPNGSIEISVPYQDFILRVEGLISETDYYVYVIGGSVQLRAPDLMDASEIYWDRIVSFQAPQAPRLDINYGWMLGIGYLILF